MDTAQKYSKLIGKPLRESTFDLYDRNILEREIIPYLESCIRRDKNVSLNTYKIMRGVRCRKELLNVFNYMWTPSTTLKVFRNNRLNTYRITDAMPGIVPSTNMIQYEGIYTANSIDMMPNPSYEKRRLMKDIIMDEDNDHFIVSITFKKVDDHRVIAGDIPRHANNYAILLVPQIRRKFVVQYAIMPAYGEHRNFEHAIIVLNTIVSIR